MHEQPHNRNASDASRLDTGGLEAGDDFEIQPIQEATLDGPLSSDDVKAMVSLIGRVAGMREPLTERRRVLMSGLTKLIDADTWLWTTSTGFRTGDVPMTVGFDYGGFNERSVALFVEHSQDTENEPLHNSKMIQEMQSWKHLTRTRRDWESDEELYNSPQWELYRKPMGIDHFIFSLVPLEDGYVSGVGLHRGVGRPDFTIRERRMTHILISQVDWMHRIDLPEDAGRHTMEFTPRLRVVFSFLLRGWNRKRIAEHIGITANTVAGYQKQVYRHFGVSTQSELLAQFVTGDGGDLPPMDAV